ncbi:MAG: hypothetical protein DCC75_08660 [Proteobacteria bacterium]|nr:MAG: hypothetical protein DCC75_08660 [Pseudomonadota bacterium]
MLVPHIIEKPTSLIPTPAKMVILGSTGSIGRSALDVVRSNRERFEVLALSAHKNSELLLEQASEFKPRYAVFGEMQDNLEWACGATEFLSGSEALLDIAALPDADIVLAAIVGHAGLRPLLAALQSGKRVALANKESLVAAGELVRAAVEKSGAQIIPVDSEHSAIFQAIQGVHTKEISRLVLTASGGPFLNRDIATLCRVTPEEAVKHPIR